MGDAGGAPMRLRRCDWMLGLLFAIATAIGALGGRRKQQWDVSEGSQPHQTELGQKVVAILGGRRL